MSKKLLRVVFTVAAVAALFIPGGFVISAGLTIGIGALVSAGIGIAGGLLLKPNKPAATTATRDRLFATFDPNAARKVIIGRTAMATDVRYQAFTGTDQEYYHQIVCVASHEVEAIEEIWFDSDMAWSVGGGVTAKFSGYLDVTARLVGTSGNGIAIDATWTTAATLTGCAYIHLRYKLTGNDKKAESPFAQTVPSRVTIRGKGAKLPDIREVGCVATDQATWDWFDDDSGRNPALQLLFYLLGWEINTKLAVGRGIPADRIDLDSFITAANLCDEAVTLAVGGTEPRYRADGIFSESDDPGTVIANLTASMNAVLRDNGGQIALHVLHNDLATPVASFDENDILGDENWRPILPLDESFNRIRGRWTDPSDAALYQLVDYPEVAITSFDGIERTESFDCQFVQSASQAQRLAKQQLQRSLYRGVYTANFGARAWQVSLGDIVELSHIGLGWTDKLFRVGGHGVATNGVTPMVLEEENAAIYAWDADESPVVTAAVPTAYDALNSPLIQAIGLGENAAFIQPAPPSAASSVPGTIWLDSDDGYRAYVRVPGSGYLQLDGEDVLLDGAPVELAWTLAVDQRIAGLGDDGVLTIDEKTRILITAEASREAIWAILDGQAATLGVVTERTAAAAARTAWLAYRDSLSPDWDDTTAATLVDRATWNALDLAYDSANEALQEAITERAVPVYQISIALPVIPAIVADFQGAISAGQFPRVLTPAVTRGGASIRTDNGVTYALANITSGGTGAVTVNNTAASADKGRITITDAMTGTFTFDLAVTVDAVAQAPFPIRIAVVPGQPPGGTGGSGGGAGNKYGQDDTLDGVSSTSFVQISDIIIVDVATGETASCAAPLEYEHYHSADSTKALVAKWRRSPTGAGTWTDLSGSPITGSVSTYDIDEFTSTPGSVAVTQTDSPSAAVYDYALWAALSSSGGNIQIVSGIASVSVGP